MTSFSRILRPVALAFALLSFTACLPNPSSEPTPFEPTATTKFEVKALTATWCHVCHGVPQMLEKLRKEFPNVDFRECDVDAPEHSKLMREYGADAVPYFVVLADGKLIGRVRGLMDYDDFAVYLRKAMAGGRGR
jgi:thiol-disulfide isomerase/thioredoxin